MSELPDRLGERFALGPLIGQGTCSRVYRAHDLLLDREAAVKVFPVADDPRVQREIQLLASLDHPSLVGVYDVGQVDGRAFVVMALFEGGSLADRLRRGPMPLGETILAVSAVADALAHVHRAGVLHRDVTPRNILFDADGRAHLSDFGVAFVADTPRITDTGIVLGSAPYLAPEQVRGDEVGPAADVYSLGLIMIEALTARPTYTGTPLEAAVARLERAPEMPPGLGDDITALLTEMTATDPAERPDAESVRLRLRRAALAREVGTGPQPIVTPVPGPRGEFEPSRLPTRALMVVGAAAMSVLLAGTVVVASTWTVRDVSSSSNPPASLSPSASAPLALPGPVPAPDGGDGSRDEASGPSSDSDAGSSRALAGWSSSGSSSGSARSTSGGSPSTAERATAPRLTEPVTARPAPRSDDRPSPRLATPPTTSSSRTTPTGDDSTSTTPTSTRRSTEETSTPSTPRLPKLTDVTKDLPLPTGRSRSTTSSTTTPKTTERSATKQVTPRSATDDDSTAVDPSGSTDTTTTTPTTTAGALEALRGAVGSTLDR